MSILYKNEVRIAGNLVAAPELSKMPSGDPVCNVNVATSVFIKDDKSPEGYRTKTEYHKVTFFRRDAEKLCNKAEKGANIDCSGYLQTDSYPDKSTGEVKYSTKIIATGLTVISNPSDRKTKSTADLTAEHKEFVDAMGADDSSF